MTMTQIEVVYKRNTVKMASVGGEKGKQTFKEFILLLYSTTIFYLFL